jgi:hypothetical protein
MIRRSGAEPVSRSPETAEGKRFCEVRSDLSLLRRQTGSQASPMERSELKLDVLFIR